MKKITLSVTDETYGDVVRVLADGYGVAFVRGWPTFAANDPKLAQDVEAKRVEMGLKPNTGRTA